MFSVNLVCVSDRVHRVVSEPWLSAGYIDTNLAEPKMLRLASVILIHALVAHKSSPSQRGHQRLPLLPCTGRSQELALTERAPALPLLPSGSLWRGVLTRARPAGHPGAFARHKFGPAGCAVGSPCCPFVATFMTEAICFHMPVTQFYVSPCLV